MWEIKLAILMGKQGKEGCTTDRFGKSASQVYSSTTN